MNVKIFNSLIKKEFRQIIRDYSNLMIAFLLPLILMIIFAYAINLDNNTIKIGLLSDGYRDKNISLIDTFKATKFLDVKEYNNRSDMDRDITAGKIKAMVIIPNDFMKNFYSGNDTASIQLLIDGSDPNISTFVDGYVNGVMSKWIKGVKIENGQDANSIIDVTTAIWYNSDLKSINFILPSSIAMIMTVVGMILTALVIAREWERGTMESLLTTKISKMDILLSKFIAYYFLTLLSAIFCSVLCICWFRVPFNGSYIVYFLTSTLFIFTSLGQGILISTLCKNQFLASLSASVFGLLPATMLSGMLFEISSMPKIVQLISYMVPSRYFSACIRNLFNAGNIWEVLLTQSLFMIGFSALMFILIYRNTKTRLE
ncbi:MAG: ABC transporter permease [Rickettsiales bacterium]|nr:ABC transporter permease [Rickettsiales bacterium]